jgi:hypothetical protein
MAQRVAHMGQWLAPGFVPAKIRVMPGRIGAAMWRECAEAHAWAARILAAFMEPEGGHAH